MGALLPMLVAAAPAATSALLTGAARGAGAVLGKAAAQGTINAVGGVVDATGNVVNAINPFRQQQQQPTNVGQQRVIYLANQPY